MENGEGNLERKLAGLAVSDRYTINGSDGLFQVMKAVEAAEATIKQQVEENNRLRSELQKANEELEKHKSGDGGYVDINSGQGLPNSAVLLTNLVQSNRDHGMQTHIGNQLENSKVNGSLDVVHGGQVVSDNSGVFQFVSPPNALFTSTRYQEEGDMDSEFRYSGRGSISMAQVNNNSSSKQDIVVKIREHEEEILQYKRRLTEYSIKEAQIRNEKYALENRISQMRLAFDQQQQDLVLAASKAISYRQDIMEENVHLTYALQAAQQERSIFVTSLMPLLREYSLHPPATDAQSIVSNIKVLFRHLQEQLLVIEGKLRESQYQLAPWRSDANPSNFSQSQVFPVELKDSLELVPQPTYSDGRMPSPDPQTAVVGDISGPPQSGVDKFKNLEHNELGKYSPPTSRNTESHKVPSQLVFSQVVPSPAAKNEGMVGKKVTFGDLVRSNEMDEPENNGHQSDRESSINWNSKASAMTVDDPNSSYSPYLPPVLEEPSSSFSEDDDPLPAIEGLQISGEAFPGQQLQASGYSVNGTTTCNFEWVRHLEDGSFHYVEGATQPNYLVTADDVNTFLAIKVQPMDDRKRQGMLTEVFANGHNKITCDPVMQNCIEKTLNAGHASYKLFLLMRHLDVWKPATLAIKKDSYSIKCSGPSSVVVAEKFSSSNIVSIRYGIPMEFSIVDSQGIEHVLRVDGSLTDVSCSRDTIVLTLRLCILKAKEKKEKKEKKRSLFFNK